MFIGQPFTYSALWIGSVKLGLSFPVTFDNPQVVQWKNFIVMPMLYFMTLYSIKDRKEIMLIVFIIVFTVFLMDGNYYQNTRWQSHETFSYDKRTLGTSFVYLGPNEIASFFAQSTLFILGLFLCERFSLRKVFYGIVACFTLYPILFLYSRGAYIAMVAGLLFYGIVKSRMILVALLIVAFSWTVILPNAVIERIQMTTTEDGMDSSAASRFVLWGDALSNIISNPITGLGFGSTGMLGFKTGAGHQRKDIHNGYIEILLEQGFLGLFLFLNIFYLGIKKGWVLFRRSNDNFFSALGLGFVGMILASLISNMFGDRWSYLNVMGHFWILLALVVKASGIVENKKEIVAA